MRTGSAVTAKDEYKGVKIYLSLQCREPTWMPDSRGDSNASELHIDANVLRVWTVYDDEVRWMWSSCCSSDMMFTTLSGFSFSNAGRNCCSCNSQLFPSSQTSPTQTHLDVGSLTTEHALHSRFHVVVAYIAPSLKPPTPPHFPQRVHMAVSRQPCLVCCAI